MIASISGTLTAFGDRFCIVETGGLGYQVFVAMAFRSAAKVGDTVTLYTHHHISDSANDLFGFPSVEEVSFFELLLTISKVGPKTAMNIMSAATIDELRAAIQHGDPTLLTKVSGVGRKTAERIVLELKEKIDVGAGEGSGALKEDADVLDALVSLGYARQEARTALRSVPPNVVGVSERVGAALKKLSNHAGS